MCRKNADFITMLLDKLSEEFKCSLSRFNAWSKAVLEQKEALQRVGSSPHLPKSVSRQQPFKCYKCDQEFVNLEQLAIHSVACKYNYQLKCCVCELTTFQKLTDLTQHISIHTGKKASSCQKSKTFEKDLKSIGKNTTEKPAKGDKSNPEQRKKENSTTGPTPTCKNRNNCVVCDKVIIGGKQHMRAHIITHTGEKRFPCNICDKAFTNNRALKQHKFFTHNIRCDNLKLFTCVVCGKLFRQEKDMKTHHKTHIMMTYTCEICQRQFNRKRNYTVHRLKHDEEKSECSICKKKFKNLSLHQKTSHSGCKHCGKVFTRKFALDMHLAWHENKKNIVCEICGKGFNSKVLLRNHSGIHADKPNAVCKICGKTFQQRSSFSRHMQTIHSTEKKHSCSSCGLKFTQSCSLTRHRLLKKFDCPNKTCNMKFCNKKLLKEHESIHHK